MDRNGFARNCFHFVFDRHALCQVARFVALPASFAFHLLINFVTFRHGLFIVLNPFWFRFSAPDGLKSFKSLKGVLCHHFPIFV